MQLQAHAGRARAIVARPRLAGGRAVAALRLAAGAVALWGLLSLAGLALTHLLGTGRLHAADLSADTWLAAHRTPALNAATFIGTSLAQTGTAIAVTVVVVAFLRWRLGRWHEALVVITVMAGELLIFFAITATVHRTRPPVPRLDAAPPTSSFPSGHTAAAVALYGAIAVMTLWTWGRRPATRAAAAALCCVPVLVGLSRLYRGMHYPSDVLAGALLGGLWLLLVTTTLLRRAPAPAGTGGRPRPSRRHAVRGRPARRQ